MTSCRFRLKTNLFVLGLGDEVDVLRLFDRQGLDALALRLDRCRDLGFGDDDGSLGVGIGCRCRRLLGDRRRGRLAAGRRVLGAVEHRCDFGVDGLLLGISSSGWAPASGATAPSAASPVRPRFRLPRTAPGTRPARQCPSGCIRRGMLPRRWPWRHRRHRNWRRHRPRTPRSAPDHRRGRDRLLSRRLFGRWLLCGGWLGRSLCRSGRCLGRNGLGRRFNRRFGRSARGHERDALVERRRPEARAFGKERGLGAALASALSPLAGRHIGFVGGGQRCVLGVSCNGRRLSAQRLVVARSSFLRDNCCPPCCCWRSRPRRRVAIRV